MKIVKNTCYGGFGLSEKAYERLIELGVPVKAYKQQKRGEDGLYEPSEDEGKLVIYDRDIGENSKINEGMKSLSGRYWDAFFDRTNRNHPLLVQVVEELGGGHRTGASGKFSQLEVVEIPDGIEYEIDDYDGMETIREAHRTW